MSQKSVSDCQVSDSQVSDTQISDKLVTARSHFSKQDQRSRAKAKHIHQRKFRQEKKMAEGQSQRSSGIQDSKVKAKKEL